MNTGIISTRYALALLKYVKITGNGQQVYEQALFLDKCLMQIDKLKELINNPKATSPKTKMEIFKVVLGQDGAPELEQFLALVVKNGRTHFLPIIIRSFISAYRRENNIHVAKLTVATPNEELVSKLVERGNAKTGGKTLIETHVDPRILGGFIFEVEDMRLDASVLNRLKTVKYQYVEQNRRIV